MNGPTPGSKEWLQLLTASKIAAVVGTSPYQSRFSLWHLMKGNLDMDEGDKPEFTVGNVLEPALVQYAVDQKGEKGTTVLLQPFYTHLLNERFAATPDAAMIHRDGLELIEAKTARYADEWSDERVPEGYYDQVQWQLACSNAFRCHVVALVAMELRLYTIERNQERINFLLAEGTRFLEELDADKTPSITDGSTSTYMAVRELHPEINGEQIEIDRVDAHGFVEAVHAAKRAEENLTFWKSILIESMDQAKTATCNGFKIAARQARGSGTPYVVAARNLPEPIELLGDTK